MITNLNDINKALEDIATENDSMPTTVMEKMNAADVNSSMLAIETQLNSLYERIRLVQDINDFATEYIKKEISTREASFKEKLKIIEDTVDLYKGTESVAVTVPFEADGSALKDRDGSSLSHMILNDSMLESGGDEMKSPNITSITYTTNSECYNNTYSNLKDGEFGISCYSVKEPPTGGIEEVITVTLQTPTLCNYASVVVSNASVSDFNLIDKSNNLIPLESDGYFDATTISGIKFKLTCTDYSSDESLITSISGYDTSHTIGIVDTPSTRGEDELIVKNMEKTIATADKEYNIGRLTASCNIYEKMNQSIKNKNERIG